MRVAPLVLVLGVPEPLVGDADATGERDRSRRRSSPCGGFGGSSDRVASAANGRNQRTATPARCKTSSIGRSIECGAPRVEEDPHAYAVARRASASACANSRPISPFPVDEGQEVDRVSAPAMASSIAGKISSPLRSTSSRLPSVAGTPITPSSGPPEPVAPRSRGVASRCAASRAPPPPACSARTLRAGSECSDLFLVLRLARARRGPPRAGPRPRRRRGSPRPRASDHSNSATMPANGPYIWPNELLTEKNSARGRASRPAIPSPRPRRRTPATTATAGGGGATTGTASSSRAVARTTASGHRTNCQARFNGRVVDGVTDRLSERQERERTDGECARGDGQRKRPPVLLNGRPVLLDAVDAVEAAFDLADERAARDQGPDQAEDETRIPVREPGAVRLRDRLGQERSAGARYSPP